MSDYFTPADIRRLSSYFLRRAAPLPLMAVPDYGFDGTKSPHYATARALGIGAEWTSGHASSDFARAQFRVPVGYGVGSTVVVRGLIATDSGQTVIIKCYKASLSATDSYNTWDTANSTEQTSIAITTNWVEVTIASLTVVVAGDTIALAFRPRTAVDGATAGNVIIGNIWLV